ncbi:MAG: hypothetical protein ACK56I_30875, partial [bacterium]
CRPTHEAQGHRAEDQASLQCRCPLHLLQVQGLQHMEGGHAAEEAEDRQQSKARAPAHEQPDREHLGASSALQRELMAQEEIGHHRSCTHQRQVHAKRPQRLADRERRRDQREQQDGESHARPVQRPGLDRVVARDLSPGYK